MSSLELSGILDKLPPQLRELGPASLAIGAGIVVFLGYVIKTVNMRRKMPPGPVGLPFLGNKHQMPPVKPWRKFEELNKVYGQCKICFGMHLLLLMMVVVSCSGPVVSLFFGSTPIIGKFSKELRLSAILMFVNLVCGTAQAAWDLLEKRSDIYSSRPRFIMG